MQDLNFIFFIAVLILSVVTHEVSHGYMANILGDHTAKRMGRLTLNPIKHFDFMGSLVVPVLTYMASNGALPFGWAKPVPYNPYNLRDQKWGEAKVAAAGPLSNILLAVFFGLLIRLGFSGAIALSAPVITILSTITLINLSLAAVNLIPVYPLDGSKILFAFLPYHMRNIQGFMERYWLILIFFFIFFGGSLISWVTSLAFVAITGI